MANCDSTKVARAFATQSLKGARCNNTVYNPIRLGVTLHNDVIAWWDDNNVPWISWRGWVTDVTTARLRDILCELRRVGFAFDEHDWVAKTRRSELYYQGKLVDPYMHFPLCGPLGAMALKQERLAREAQANAQTHA